MPDRQLRPGQFRIPQLTEGFGQPPSQGARRLSFPLHFRDADEYKEFREGLFVALRGGAVPAVLLPSTEMLIYGDLTQSVSFARPDNGTDYRNAQLSIEEGAPFSIH